MLLNKENISCEHCEIIQFATAAVLRYGGFASGLASLVSEGRSADQRETYGHKHPSRVLLASEKAHSKCVWVFRSSFLTCNISYLTSSSPSVCLGLCVEQQVFPMLRKVYITF